MGKLPPPRMPAKPRPGFNLRTRSVEFDAYLTERGITKASADACGLRSLTADQHAELMDQPALRRERVVAGLIPSFDFEGAQREDFYRTRLFKNYTPSRSKKPAKFLQRAGSGSHLYLPPILKHGQTWADVARDPTIALMITEGEMKAIAACQLGFTCCAVTGVYNFLHRPDDAEDSVLIDDMRRFEWKTRTVSIVFDSDAAMNPNVRKAEDRLLKVLYDLSARPFIVRLPSSRVGDGKVGLDDFLAKWPGRWSCHYARAALNKLLAAATSPYVPQIIATTDLADLEFKPVEHLVGALVPTVGVTLLASAPKIGKSFMLLQAGHAVASGVMAFGGHATQKRAVLYLALEDTLPRIMARLRRMQLEPLADLAIATSWPTGDAAYEALRRHLEQHPHVKLVMIDTWQRFRRAANVRRAAYEDDYAELGALKAIVDRFGVAVVLAHHTKKGKTEDPFEAVLGSTALMGAVDAALVIHRLRGEADAVLHVVGRDVEGQELAFEFAKDSTCTWSSIGRTESSASHSGLKRAFIDVLRQAARPLGLAEAADAVGAERGKPCSKPHAREVLRNLIGEGIVEQDGTRSYCLSSGTAERA